MAGGRGLAGCGHLLVSLLGLLLLLARSGTRALVCLPCDESKCEEPKSCPGSIVQGFCGCCYMCARQRNESCGGAYGLHGACDRGLRCVIRPPLNGDSITEYEVGVCEGTAARRGPPPTWPAPPPRRWWRRTKFGRDFPEERGLFGKEGRPPPPGVSPASLGSQLAPSPDAWPAAGEVGLRGWGPAGGRSPPAAHKRTHVWPIGLGLGLGGVARLCARRWGRRGQGALRRLWRAPRGVRPLPPSPH